MNTRLKQFLAAENISQAQFADTIKVVRASVSHVLAGRNNPGYDFIKAIMDNYPALNMEWLILGKGKMYKDKIPVSLKEEVLEEGNEPGLLFNGFSEDTIEMMPEEDEISANEVDKVSKIITSNEMNTTIDTSQVSVKQRKVSKVIILFDDGSFQEM